MRYDICCKITKWHWSIDRASSHTENEVNHLLFFSQRALISHAWFSWPIEKRHSRVVFMKNHDLIIEIIIRFKSNRDHVSGFRLMKWRLRISEGIRVRVARARWKIQRRKNRDTYEQDQRLNVGIAIVLLQSKKDFENWTRWKKR